MLRDIFSGQDNGQPGWESMGMSVTVSARSLMIRPTFVDKL